MLEVLNRILIMLNYLLILMIPRCYYIYVNTSWLHSYDLRLLDQLNGFNFVAETINEDDLFVPNLIRGRSGVALYWSQSINDFISPITFPRSDRLLGVRIRCSPCDLIVFSVYIPFRSGCTDEFHEMMDQLDSTFTLFTDAVILFAGDFNADRAILVVILVVFLMSKVLFWLGFCPNGVMCLLISACYMAMILYLHTKVKVTIHFLLLTIFFVQLFFYQGFLNLL